MPLIKLTKKELKLFLIPVVVLCSVLPRILESFYLGAASCQREGDLALIALNVRDVLEGNHLVGVYSRFKFAHPGPLILYLYGIGSFIFGFLSSFAGRIVVTQELLNLLSIGVITFVSSVREKNVLRALWRCFWLCLGIHLAHPRALQEIWNPVALLCPIAAYLVLVGEACIGSALYWYASVFFGALCIQTHIGSVSVVGPTLLYSLFIQWKNFSTEFTKRLVIGACLGTFFFIPPLIEAIQHEQLGNIGKIIKFLTRHQGTHSLSEISQLFSQLYLSSKVAVIIQVLLFCLPLIGRVRGGSSVRADLLFLGNIGLLLSMYRTYGPLHTYLFWTHVVLTALMAAEILSILFQRNIIIGQVLAGGCCCALVWHFLPYSPEYCGDEHRGKQIIAALHRYPEPYCLDIEKNKEFGPAALTGLFLKQSKREFFVAKKWAIHFGRFRTMGCERAKTILHFSSAQDSLQPHEKELYRDTDLLVSAELQYLAK